MGEVRGISRVLFRSFAREPMGTRDGRYQILHVERRLLRRWPPLILRPEDDGRGNMVFVQRGSSVAVGLLAMGVVFVCIGPVLWSITGGVDILLPTLFSGLGAVSLVAAALFARSTFRLTLLVREQRALLQYRLGPIAWEVSCPLAGAELRTHKLQLMRRWSDWPFQWKGEVVVIAVPDAIMFPIAASKSPRDISEYVEQLPEPIARLPRVEGPVILSYY